MLYKYFMINDTIGICLIGAGRAGMIHARNFLSKVPGARMVAISDTSAQIASAAATELHLKHWYTDYHQALAQPDVDAVVVVTPTKYHCNIVIDAANAGKHILCEKPMAMNVSECQKMIYAANQNQVNLQIGFMRRFDKNFLRAKEMIDSNLIGDIVSVKSATRGPSVPQEWMYDITKSNGPLAEVNSHDIDTLRWFTKSEFKSVNAIAGNFRCPQAQERYPDFYDSVLMNVKLENNCIGNIDGAQGVQYGYDAKVDILGTTGCITIGSLNNNNTILYTKENGMTQDNVQSWMDLFADAYLKEDISFILSIYNNTSPEVTGYDGLKAVEIVEAGNRSIQTEKTIFLNHK